MGRRRGGGENKWERAGSALSDMGENLGRLAYIQLQIDKEKNDQRKAELIAEATALDRKTDTYKALLPGMKEFGSPLEEQNRVATGLGITPNLNEGPTLQRVPGVRTEDELVEFTERKSWGEAKAKALGEKLMPSDMDVTTARGTLRTEATSDYEKQQSLQMDYAVKQSDKLAAHLTKYRADQCDDLGLTGKECAEFKATGKTRERLSDSQLLGLIQKDRSLALTISPLLNMDYQANLTDFQSAKEGTLEYENKKRAAENSEILVNIFKERSVYSLPEVKARLEDAVQRGLMTSEQADQMTSGSGTGSFEPSANNDAMRLQEIQRRKKALLEKQQNPTPPMMSPAESALSNVGVNSGNFSLGQ